MIEGRERGTRAGLQKRTGPYAPSHNRHPPSTAVLLMSQMKHEIKVVVPTRMKPTFPRANQEKMPRAWSRPRSRSFRRPRRKRRR